jgi:DNA-binding transcriptional LysR family regulator
LRALEAFVRVVRLGSAKAAAVELALSPSALSRWVATLEEYFDLVQWFGEEVVAEWGLATR